MILYANGSFGLQPIASELATKLNYAFESGFLKSNTNQKVLNNTTKFINNYSTTQNRYELFVLLFISPMRDQDEWVDKIYKYHLFLRRKGIKHLFANNNFVYNKLKQPRATNWHSMYFNVNDIEIQPITTNKLYEFIH